MVNVFIINFKMFEIFISVTPIPTDENKKYKAYIIHQM